MRGAREPSDFYQSAESCICPYQQDIQFWENRKFITRDESMHWHIVFVRISERSNPNRYANRLVSIYQALVQFFLSLISLLALLLLFFSQMRFCFTSSRVLLFLEELTLVHRGSFQDSAWQKRENKQVCLLWNHYTPRWAPNLVISISFLLVK